MVLCAFPDLFADTYYYRLSYRDDPATTMVVGWSGDDGTVHYGTTDEGSDYTAYPMNRPTDRTVNHRNEPHNFVRLEGLTPNTVYYFVIRDITGAVSERFSFKTMADDANVPLSYINGGDTRLGFNQLFEPCECRQARQDGNRLVSKLRPDFIVFNGDFVLNSFLALGQVNNEWRMWFEDWQLTIGPDGRMAPLMIATGNHEDDVDYPLVSDPNFRDVYNLFDIPNSDVYYALNFHDNLLRMYSLNTEIHGCFDMDQRNWLTADLQNYSTISNTPYWKAVSYHQPIIPHSDKDIRNDLRECWAPLFDEYNVQLAMESHSHSMKTTHPISRSDEEGNDGGFIRDEPCGTVYIGEGNWAAPQRSLYPPRDWTRQTASIRSFYYITVSAGSMKIYSPMFENIDNVNQALDDDLGSPLPIGVTLYEDAVALEDAGPVIEILNNNEACSPGLPTAAGQNVIRRAEIYPNPVKSYLYIHLKEMLPDLEIEVYDARGKLCSDVRIQQVSALEYRIDASTICSNVGVVMIKHQGDAEAHKFIKQ
jgi:hypothetical protein